jgi:hypothetical protein
MRFPIVWLALAIIATCALIFIATSEVDIDYSHSVVGTGTLITDYHMGAEKNSEASGKVRGTGNVMNKYLFLSGNDSRNMTIEDQFVLSGEAASRQLTLGDLPTGTEEPDRFRLTGAAWADRLEVMSAVNASMNSSNNSNQSLGQARNVSFPITGKEAFNWRPPTLDVNASLNTDQAENIFDYQSSQYNSSEAIVSP